MIVVEIVCLLDSSCMLLWWMLSTGSNCVSLVSSGVLLGVVVYH
jgi:hypothetical protein